MNSPDGRFLVFLSAKSAVDSGAHWASDSLYRLEWSSNGDQLSHKIVEVLPVVQCPEENGFPGLYSPSFNPQPWLLDGTTMITSSAWGSIQVILSIDVLSGKITKISPQDSSSSWSVLSVHGSDILAVSSSPVDPPQIKYGCFHERKWKWIDLLQPSFYPEKVTSILSSLDFKILKIYVTENREDLKSGAKLPYEAIFVSSKCQAQEACPETPKKTQHQPLIVVLHGGPHSFYSTSYSKSLAYLASLGFNLLEVNYRGSLGFGEDALQSLPGKIGTQDVKDVLAAIDHVINLGLADPSKVAVLGGSHGGFLTTHLIGQEPGKFAAAAVRNPLCNLALMIGTTDIPDWCYVEAYGSEGKGKFSEAPLLEDLGRFYNMSPIAHISKVKTPVLFLLGGKDLRVPTSNGLQYARALKERGVETKVILFPNDVHAIDRPQSDFESFLNIGAWFKKYL